MYFIRSINIISEVNTLWLVKNQRLKYTSTSTLKTCKELLIEEQILNPICTVGFFKDIFKTTNYLNKKLRLFVFILVKVLRIYSSLPEWREFLLKIPVIR